jgi:hypothetical protein
MVGHVDDPAAKLHAFGLKKPPLSAAALTGERDPPAASDHAVPGDPARIAVQRT